MGRHDAPTVGSELVAFVVGAAVALVAQGLGHSLTLRRERRADFVSAVDKAVDAYTDGGL